jgi:hypothetical protein
MRRSRRDRRPGRGRGWSPPSPCRWPDWPLPRRGSRCRGSGLWVRATRRLGFLALAAPPLFVLTGVVAGLLHSPVRDIWIWPAAWILAGVAASLARSSGASAPTRPLGRLRVVHGVAGALILLFVAFHLSNHLMGLLGPEAHGGS